MHIKTTMQALPKQRRNGRIRENGSKPEDYYFKSICLSSIYRN
jgi:hypothetical protein